MLATTMEATPRAISMTDICGVITNITKAEAANADLIRGYVSPDLAKRLDLDTLERCNGSYISQDLRGRENDIVWRVKVKTGWVYIYLLLEFQSTVDRWMAVRLLCYIALLWQDLIAGKQLTSDGLLPPVFSRP